MASHAPEIKPKARSRAFRKVRVGMVISDRMKKTIVVRVSRLARHPLYLRVVRRANSFKVHDESNSAKIGDVVKIMETRPLSKDKRWRLVEILRRASTAPAVPTEEESLPEAARVKRPSSEVQAPQEPAP